jgi:hypothetical protein
MITSKLGLALVICFWGLVIGSILWWQVRERRSAKEGAIERKALNERILQPDWVFYERHLQRPAPAALRELFADHDLITTCGLNYSKDWGISSFNPLDEDSLQDTATTRIGHDMVPFAVSGCGDPIYLRPGATEPDTVYMAYHDDPGDVEIFAESVAVMLERLRHENQAA